MPVRSLNPLSYVEKPSKKDMLEWTVIIVVLQVSLQILVVVIEPVYGRFPAICTMHGSYRVVQSCR